MDDPGNGTDDTTAQALDEDAESLVYNGIGDSEGFDISIQPTTPRQNCYLSKLEARLWMRNLSFVSIKSLHDLTAIFTEGGLESISPGTRTIEDERLLREECVSYIVKVVVEYPFDSNPQRDADFIEVINVIFETALSLRSRAVLLPYVDVLCSNILNILERDTEERYNREIIISLLTCFGALANYLFVSPYLLSKLLLVCSAKCASGHPGRLLFLECANDILEGESHIFGWSLSLEEDILENDSRSNNKTNSKSASSGGSEQVTSKELQNIKLLDKYLGSLKPALGNTSSASAIFNFRPNMPSSPLFSSNLSGGASPHRKTNSSSSSR